MSLGVKTGRDSRLRALLVSLEGLAVDLERGELPDLFAGLEHVRRAAELRFMVPTPSPPSRGLAPLLTVKQVEELLVVSQAEAYRLARGPLRSAAIDVGEGTLRFDPLRVKQFLESRRRA